MSNSGIYCKVSALPTCKDRERHDYCDFIAPCGDRQMDHTLIRGRYLGSLLKTLDAPEEHWRRLKIASRADTVEQAQDRHWYGFMYNSNLLARLCHYANHLTGVLKIGAGL